MRGMRHHSNRQLTATIFSSLRSDRLVKVYVGDSTEPFLIQQTLLKNTSDYFTRALCSDSFDEGALGVLRFREDNIKTWQILLYWIFNRDLPEEVTKPSPGSIMDCWILGDNYDVPSFQDDAMFTLIQLINDSEYLGTENVRSGIERTTQRSALRRLLVEELVLGVYYHRDVGIEELDEWEGAGFLSDFVKAKDWYNVNNDELISRFETNGVGNVRWKVFMVGAGARRLAEQA